jgi:hypothetical protein
MGRQMGYFESSRLFFLAAVRFFRLNLDLIWIPLIGLFINLIILLLLCGVLRTLFLLYFDGMASWLGNESIDLFLGIALIIFFSFMIIAVGGFSTAVLLASCMKRLRGEIGTIREAFLLVWSRKWPLLTWALMLTTFGLIIQFLERSHCIIATFLEVFLNGSFSLGAYFGLPVLLFRGEGPIQSLKTGMQLFGQGWRKVFSINAFLWIPALLVLLMIVLLAKGMSYHPLFSWPWFLVLSGFVLILSFVTRMLSTVVRAALFIGLFEKGQVNGFDSELIQTSIAQRNINFRRRFS